MDVSNVLLSGHWKKMGANNYVRPFGKINEPAVFASATFA